MNARFTYRDQLYGAWESARGWLAEGFDLLSASLQKSWSKQHKADDTHGAVTADSLYTNLRGSSSTAAGSFTEYFGYSTPVPGRIIFGDGTGWTLTWSRWSSTGTAKTRTPTNTANLTDIMTLSDTGTLTPQALSGPSGVVALTTTAPAVGSGGTATLGKVGGSGPATTTQNKWMQISLNGTTVWIPVWV